MQQNDTYLLDMLVAARKAAKFAHGITYEQFLKSDLHQEAIFKALVTMGEAATHVEKDVRSAHPEIAWKKIVGLRNRLVHAYFDISRETVWKIINEDIPELIGRLERIVPQDDGQS